METSGTLSKAEYQYLKTIEAAEKALEKKEADLQKAKVEIADLQKKVEALQTENEQLKNDLQDTTSECQKYCDDISNINDELEKQIEEHEAQVPPKEATAKEDKIIYHKCGMMGKLLRRNDRSNWMQVEVLASDTQKIQSLVDDGYEKKESELPTQLKK